MNKSVYEDMTQKAATNGIQGCMDTASQYSPIMEEPPTILAVMNLMTMAYYAIESAYAIAQRDIADESTREQVFSQLDSQLIGALDKAKRDGIKLGKEL